MVERLAADLGTAGADVWLDRDRLQPGERWREAIRGAIEGGMFFVACFSDNYVKRDRTHMNEELDIAIEELRKRPRDRAWFLPVLLNPGTMPRFRITASEYLDDIHYVELHADWDRGIQQLLGVISPRGDDLARSPSGLDGERFRRPVAATYLTWRERFEAIIDDLALEDPPRRWEEIQRQFHVGLILPSHYLYQTDLGADSWLKLCQDAAFRGHANAMRLWRSSTGDEVALAVRERLGREDFDYVSLGCGNGEKDAVLLGHWLRDRADITYYPFDISLRLLTHAARHVVDELPHGKEEGLQIKAALANLDQLPAIAGAFQQRPSPKVFSILGNSLGVLGSERQLLSVVRDQMREEDLLILEVELNSQEERITEFDSDQLRRFYFNPLRECGVSFDPEKMGARIADGISSIPEATTQVIEYHDVDIGKSRFEAVALGSLPTYAIDGFLGALKGVGLSVVSSWRPADSVDAPFVCVVRRLG